MDIALTMFLFRGSKVEVIDKDKQLLINLVAMIRIRAQTIKAATSITYKKLSAVTKGSNEMELIAEDALSESYELLTKSILAGNFNLKESISQAEAENSIAKYLLISVSGYCDKRLRQWSQCNEQGNVGTKARVVLTEEEHMHSEGLDIVRLKYVGSGESENDKPFNMDELLDELDLSDDERWIVKTKSTICEIAKEKGKVKAITFAQIAQQYGQSEDKYRKQHKRAVDKIKQQVTLSNKFSAYLLDK